MARFLLWSVGALGGIVVAVALFGWWLLSGSLAKLDGNVAAPISAPVEISRDAQGLVTLRGEQRTDIAFAMGFVHAQERLFQMDLLRRNAAGELSELFGSMAVSHDTRVRLHQFRRRAEAALAAMPVDDQTLLEHYAAGVNQGMAELRSRPFEYLLLRQSPRAWHPADSLLALYTMYMDLQDEWLQAEQSLAVMQDMLPPDWFAFLTPSGGRWDATLLGNIHAEPLIIPERPLRTFQSVSASSLAPQAPETHAASEIGSNNWAVSGELTEHGAGMIANDMHLRLMVPNTWFRASWELHEPGVASAPRVTGVTLPGAPLMVVGSNESIAWGFTNSYGDYGDLVHLELNEEKDQYLTPDGWRSFDLDTEMVTVKGADALEVPVAKTVWGPVIGEDHNGIPLVIRWVAHEPGGANLALLGLESAENVESALEIAKRAGMPGQNLVVVDREGDLGWTIMGRLPKRFGYPDLLSQKVPADWSDGQRGWDGWLPVDEYPQVLNPESGRIWTANARIVGEEYLTIVGDGDGALGARQQQIRDRLFEKTQFSEEDFLAIQRDAEARFLSRWQQLLVELIDDEVVATNPDLAQFKSRIETWQGQAGADSAGYLLVKRFREQVISQTVGHVYDYLQDQSPSFSQYLINKRVEYPVWQLLEQQPAAHVPALYTTWRELLVAIAEQVNSRYGDSTWGDENTLAIQHPLSRAVPSLSRWLDMPAQPVDGDTLIPFVQGRSFGASQRMVVSPGHESEGYFQMPTGQSGHPLSPFYRAGHQDWVDGMQSPFLPGATEHQLTLKPL